MTPLFSVDRKDIEMLNEHELTELMNRLIRAELAALGQPQQRAELSVKIHEPDGGVDARLTDIAIPQGVSTWIPPGLSVWQYKKGYSGPAEAVREFEKAGVQEALNKGGAYRFVIAEEASIRRKNNFSDNLHSQCRHPGVPADCLLLGASDIAAWAEQHPAILWHLGKIPGGLMSHEHWSQDRRHAMDYHEDACRLSACQAINSFLGEKRHHVHLRVEGIPGVGKPRLVLESLRGDGIAERTLYAQEPASIPHEFLAWFRTHPEATCVLVVDECNVRESENFEAQADGYGGRLKLITIGMGTARGELLPTRVLRVEPLEAAQMSKLIQTAFRGLSRQHVEYVVQMTQGFVKLAVGLAQAITDNPELSSPAALARHRSIEAVLNEVFRDPNERTCMEAISLLWPIGWEGPLQDQKQAVCNFLAVPESEADRFCEKNYERGFITKKGRYRYVTPHILAIWLASSVWRARKSKMFAFLESLPSPDAGKALLRRLKYMGDAELAKPIVEKLLSRSGLFVDLDDLDTDERASIFSMLTEAEPASGLAALERVVGHLSKDELLKLNGGRRHVVWTLEKLVWRREFFHRAARLLLGLAEAENEQCTNNATGIWLQLFRPFLSGTEVPGLERLAFLRQLYETRESYEKRRLIIRAAGAAVERRDVSRGSEGEMLGGYAPREEWRPTTGAEHKQMIQSALSLIESGLADPRVEVRDQAFEELVEDAWPFFAFGLGLHFVQALDKGNPLGDEKRRFKARESLEFLFSTFENRLSGPERTAVRERLHSLTGVTFHDRLRRWVGPPTHADWRRPPEEGVTELSQELEALADEALADPERLWREVEWLSSPEAFNAASFGLRLGERDANVALLTHLEDLGRKRSCVLLLAAYVQGRASKAGSKWTNRLLSRWIKSEPNLTPALLQCLLLRPADPAAGRRLVRLLEKGWLSASQIQSYPFTGWASGLPVAAVRALADVVLQAGTVESCEAAARLLSWWLDKHPGQLSGVRQVVWRAIDSPAAVGTRGHWGHEWPSLARSIGTQDPARVVSALLKVYETEPDKAPTLNVDDRLKLLRELTQQYPHAVWPLVGALLLKKGRAALTLHLALHGWYAQCIPTEMIVAWCESHRPDGPYVAASLCPLRGVPLADPGREVLVRFGDDKRVRDRLNGNLLSGSFTGSITAWLESHLKNVRQWKEDPHPNVRTWASEAEQSIIGSIEHWKLREEEEDIHLL